MRKLLLTLLLITCLAGYSQSDTAKWLRAFPVTGYMPDLNDSTQLVQVQLPEGLSFKEKQPGVVYGVYNNSKEEAVQKGFGRCQLIKGQYYYFAISKIKGGQPLKEGDLLYTRMNPVDDIYYGLLPKLAGHYIRLQDVYENPYYDRYSIFYQWQETDENKALDSMIADIHFTGKYFLENDPTQNKPVTTGTYKGKKTLDIMVASTVADLKKFFAYILARPRLYAGKDWKVSEIFATWVTEGAPEVVKE